MILVLEKGLGQHGEQEVLLKLEKLGVSAQLGRLYTDTVIVIESDVSTRPTHIFSQIDGVAKVLRIGQSYPKVLEQKDSSVKLERVVIGGGAKPIIIAGPCSVEGLEQLLTLADGVKSSGAQVLRGGAFKPRTSPYEFCGLQEAGLAYLKEASKLTGLPVVSEVMSEKQIEAAHDYVDVFQIGARNMYNYELLKEVGRTKKPVLLKRALSATIDEFLYAAEYVMLGGNNQIILCERGIRTFETKTRNTLDLSAVPVLKSMTKLPVIIDPSHATGKRSLVRSMSRAAIACGADGLMLEVHNNPSKSISDAEQAISVEELALINSDLEALYSTLQSLDVKAKSQGKTKFPIEGQLVLSGTAIS
ncbi:MAG: 3-deoxy-7-phosphoheptulonate synthase [Cyanobacteria bacterium TGS_CYA1]|nr:3-deoxy-7-phosphoheptulonate synthase [Cyanobacteria bacterium TGS_CYA1]MDX2105523.1 3-deoxy-7-phosphoheptulonate synthase [Candidatus Melainabacteria bacterium]